MSNLVLYLITVLVWGSTWFAIEFQLGTVEPEVSIVYRYALASLLLFGWCKYKRLDLSFKLREHGWFILLGTFLFGLNYFLAYRAQIYITSALNAIAFSTIVWMNILNARIWFGVRAGRRILSGSLLGIAGIVILFAPQIRDISVTDAVFFGSMLAVIGALTASFGNMVSQGAQKSGLPVVQSNAWGMFYGALLSAITSVLAGHTFSFDWSAGYIGSLVYLTVFGSIIAFGAYLTLLGRIGAHKAGYAMVMFPVAALILSMVFEGFKLDWPIVVGTLLVLAGNIFVLEKRTEPKRIDNCDAARAAG
ncbi:MAG: EamA family transporter [Woeseiaceae bacterium]|nr:EamA family transporter [Woeseiaceae bacterium]